jgi:hypothetical protein
MGFEVVEIQPTPNPNAMKFVLNDAKAAANDPLAARLFTIPGVSSLLFLNDFITVNKRPEAKWAEIKRAVKKALGD